MSVGVLRRTPGRVHVVHRESVFLNDGASGWMMEMTIMQVVDVSVMADGPMAASGAVHVSCVWMGS